MAQAGQLRKDISVQPEKQHTKPVQNIGDYARRRRSRRASNRPAKLDKAISVFQRMFASRDFLALFGRT